MIKFLKLDYCFKGKFPVLHVSCFVYLFIRISHVQMSAFKRNVSYWRVKTLKLNLTTV